METTDCHAKPLQMKRLFFNAIFFSSSDAKTESEMCIIQYWNKGRRINLNKFTAYLCKYLDPFKKLLLRHLEPDHTNLCREVYSKEDQTVNTNDPWANPNSLIPWKNKTDFWTGLSGPLNEGFFLGIS